MEDLHKHKFIVFCSDHYNPLGVCRSLGEKGLSPIVILVGEKSILVAKSKYVKTIHKVSTIEDGLTYLIKAYGNCTLNPFVYSCSDDIQSILDYNYELLKDKFYFFNAGENGRINYYMEKIAITNLAENCGIPKPKGCVLKCGELPKNLSYPVLTKVTKSTKGAWKNDVFICKSEMELSNAYKKIKAEEVLVQEYINKKNEICLDGFSINGGEEIWMPYTSEYIRFTPKGYGNYMWIKPFTNEIIKQQVSNIIKEVRFSGIFSVEILIDFEDNLYFLEVNFRNSTWSYAYTYAGLNLPYYWAKSTLEGYIDYASVTLRNKPFKAMAEFNDYQESVKTGKVSFWKWLKDFISCEVSFVYNNKDIIPFLSRLFLK